MPKKTKERARLSPDRFKNFIPISFWALFFFLCASDRVFGFQFHGLHFRWGQFLLLGAALACTPRIYQAFKNTTANKPLIVPILFAWFPFFVLYALAAGLSSFPGPSYLKLGWGIFNILGAALVVLGSRENENLSKGFLLALTGISLILWIDSTSMQCLGQPPLLGFSQIMGEFQSATLYRPHAFYYEPSYAGSAFAFAFPLILTATSGWGGWRATFIPALCGSAVILTGSRTGFLCLCASLLFIFAIGFWKDRKTLWGRATRSLLAALALVFFFYLLPGGKTYLDFLWRNLGPQNITANLQKAHPTSESVRVREMEGALQKWKEAPLLGSGVAINKTNPQNHLFDHQSTNTWVELAVESGLLGLLAFLFAVGMSMKAAWERNSIGPSAIFILAAWFAHFTVNLNFTQTFPRLDYWLLFFWSIALLTGGAKNPKPKFLAKRAARN